MNEVVAIIRRDKLSATKKALTKIGIDSMTIYSVEGRGQQGGTYMTEIDPEVAKLKMDAVSKVLKNPTPSEYALTHTLTKPIYWIPKRMLRIVVSDIPVGEVVDAIVSANQTGSHGDGKIFVIPIDDALRVRTGQHGDDAIR